MGRWEENFEICVVKKSNIGRDEFLAVFEKEIEKRGWLQDGKVFCSGQKIDLTLFIQEEKENFTRMWPKRDN